MLDNLGIAVFCLLLLRCLIIPITVIISKSTEIFKIVSELKEKKIRLIAIKNNFDMKAGDQSDIVTDVLLFAFGLSAQIERQLISERTKQGLAAARERGRHPGRHKGARPYYVKLRDDQADIMRKRAAGASVLSLAREYGVR